MTSNRPITQPHQQSNLRHTTINQSVRQSKFGALRFSQHGHPGQTQFFNERAKMDTHLGTSLNIPRSVRPDEVPHILSNYYVQNRMKLKVGRDQYSFPPSSPDTQGFSTDKQSQSNFMTGNKYSAFSPTQVLTSENHNQLLSMESNAQLLSDHPHGQEGLSLQRSNDQLQDLQVAQYSQETAIVEKETMHRRGSESNYDQERPSIVALQID